MFINRSKTSGFTLVEVMVASAIGVLVAGVIVAIMFFSSRSYVAMTNYTEMSQRSQLALDKMSREIRQASGLTSYSPTELTFQDVSGGTFGFKYDPDERKLFRVASDKSTIAYLTDCDDVKFWIYQHTMQSNRFKCYDPAYLSSARVIQMTWRCSRQILGSGTTENVQSAQVVMRNH